MGAQRDNIFSAALEGQPLMELLQKCIVRQVPAWKGDEDDRAARFPKQPDFRESRMFLRFRSNTIVRIEENEVCAIECVTLAYSPSAATSARRHGVTMEQSAIRPDRRPFERGDAAFR